jgi:hypothetical protein
MNVSSFSYPVSKKGVIVRVAYNSREWHGCSTDLVYDSIIDDTRVGIPC